MHQSLHRCRFLLRSSFRCVVYICGLVMLVYCSYAVYQGVLGGRAFLLTRFSHAFNLTVRDIRIHGLKHASENGALNALGVGLETPLLVLDVWQLRDAMQHRLVWAKEVVVKKVLPSGLLEIFVTEYEPAAIWVDETYEGVSFLVDKEGVLIMPYVEQTHRFGDLVTLKGKNAYQHVDQMLDIVKVDPEFAKRIAVFLRVGDRRWDITLRCGTLILLPEEDFLNAWRYVVDIITHDAQGKNPPSKIDCRVKNRVYFAQ